MYRGARVSADAVSVDYKVRHATVSYDVLDVIWTSMVLEHLFISRHYDGLKTMAGDVKLFLSDEHTEHFLKIFVLLYADDTIVLAETAD